MPAKSSVKRSACTKPAAPPSSPSANPLPDYACRFDAPKSERIDPAVFGRSSNGRTTASDAVYLGSNPSLPANTKPRQMAGFFVGREATETNHRSTKSSGTILDSRRLAPRSGVGPMDGTNNPSLPPAWHCSCIAFLWVCERCFHIRRTLWSTVDPTKRSY
jgi:hypothetical protein